MIEKLETGYTVDLGKNSDGSRIVADIDSAHMLKINELIEQSNRQDEAIQYLAITTTHSPEARGEVLSLLSSK